MSLPAPANNWRWIARMPLIPGGPSNAGVVAEGIDFQFRSITAQPRFGGATHRHYPTVNDMSSFNMSFYETESYVATQYLTAWQQLVVDPVYGIFGMPSVYKKDIFLEMYNFTDQKAFTGRLIECWPSQIGSFNMTYNESGRLIVTCTFSCTRSVVGEGGSAQMMNLAGLGIRTLINGASQVGNALGAAIGSTFA